jgi:uncharacterized DUF497 family protein
MDDLFEWDLTKAETNLAKHGISFEEASSLFIDTNSPTIRNTGSETANRCRPHRPQW